MKIILLDSSIRAGLIHGAPWYQIDPLVLGRCFAQVRLPPMCGDLRSPQRSNASIANWGGGASRDLRASVPQRALQLLFHTRSLRRSSGLAPLHKLITTMGTTAQPKPARYDFL